MYGGKNISAPQKSLNDLFALNINTWVWKKLFTIEAPPPSEDSLIIKSGDD